MHRPTLGLIAALLLGLSVFVQLRCPEAGIAGPLLRVGLVVGALWLAHPQLRLLPKWMIAVLLGTLLLVSWRPKILWFALPVLILLVILRPRRPGAQRVVQRK